MFGSAALLLPLSVPILAKVNHPVGGTEVRRATPETSTFVTALPTAVDSQFTISLDIEDGHLRSHSDARCMKHGQRCFAQRIQRVFWWKLEEFQDACI